MSAPGRHVLVDSEEHRYADLLAGKYKATPLSTPAAVKARMAGCKWLLDYAPYQLSFDNNTHTRTAAASAAKPPVIATPVNHR